MDLNDSWHRRALPNAAAGHRIETICRKSCVPLPNDRKEIASDWCIILQTRVANWRGNIGGCAISHIVAQPTRRHRATAPVGICVATRAVYGKCMEQDAITRHHVPAQNIVL